MTYTISELNALVRLYLFHTGQAFSIAQVRDMARNEIVGFTRCEIHAEIEANET